MPNQLRHVQHLGVAHAGRGAADARQDRANGNQDVGVHAVLRRRILAVAHGRQDGAANQEDNRVEVDDRAEEPHPRPAEDAPGEAMRFHQRVVDRRQHDADRGDEHVEDERGGEQVRRAPLSIRYTVPCASGAPPRSAPVMYQALKMTGFHPSTVVHASVNVPAP